MDSFSDASRDDLIVHALQALVGCVSGDDELTKDNGSIAIVGKNETFTLLEGDALQPYLDRLELRANEEEEDDDDDAEEELEPMET